MKVLMVDLPFTRVLLMNPWSGVRPVNLLKGHIIL